MTNSPQEQALVELLDMVGDADAGTHSERARVLALQWPSLAAAFAKLLAAHDMRVPRPWRLAARLADVVPYPDDLMAVTSARGVQARIQPLDEENWCHCTAFPFGHPPTMHRSPKEPT